MNDPEAHGIACRRPLQRDFRQRGAHLGRIAQPAGLPDAGRKLRPHGDRVSIQAKHDGNRKRLRRPAPPQGGGDSQRRDKMRGIAVPVKQAVQHCRPAEVLDQTQNQPFFLGETVLLRQDREARVDQRQEADVQFGSHLFPPINSCAVIRASAISAIRFP